MVKKRFLIAIIVSIFALAIGIGPNALAKEADWKFFTYFPANDRVVKSYNEMVADINTSAAKKLKLNLYAAGELPYKPVDGIKIVATDKVQMADGAVGFQAGDVPEFNVYGMPFLCTTFEGFFKTLNLVAPMMNEHLLEKFKIRTFFHWTMPPQNLWTVKPVKTLDELKGIKIRAWNPEQVTMLKTLGAIPVSIASAEVPTSLQRGVIDGAITSALSVNDWKLYDFVHYGLMINFAMGHQFVLINLSEFNKLPKDVQGILNKKGEKWFSKYKELTPQFEAEARANLVKQGMQLFELSQADLQAAKTQMRPMWDEWAQKNGPLAQKMLKQISDALGK
jgi:TRAP-type C4-dicarboxylate transport system substrate-binding protein